MSAEPPRRHATCPGDVGGGGAATPPPDGADVDDDTSSSSPSPSGRPTPLTGAPRSDLPTPTAAADVRAPPSPAVPPIPPSPLQRDEAQRAHGLQPKRGPRPPSFPPPPKRGPLPPSFPPPPELGVPPPRVIPPLIPRVIPPMVPPKAGDAVPTAPGPPSPKRPRLEAAAAAAEGASAARIAADAAEQKAQTVWRKIADACSREAELTYMNEWALRIEGILYATYLASWERWRMGSHDADQATAARDTWQAESAYVRPPNEEEVAAIEAAQESGRRRGEEAAEANTGGRGGLQAR